MIRNFTAENEAHMISIIESVTPDGIIEKIEDFFGDLGLTVSGWFGKLDIGDYLGNLDEYHKKVLDKNNTSAEKLHRIFNNVREDDTQMGLKQSSNQMTYSDPVINYLEGLIEALGDGSAPIDSIHLVFGLLNLKNQLRDNRKKGLYNPAYSSDPGYYGGKQHGCQERWNTDSTFRAQAREIARKYYPNYSDTDIKSFVEEMNHHGCHYMAAVNTIFAQYLGREEAFEKAFGFPMYDENGHVNSDLVMLDFYARQSSIDGGHTSLEPDEINDQWSDYLDEKNIKVEVNIIDVTVDNYYDLSENGEIIIRYSPLRLRNQDGQLVDNRNGGHATVITGVDVIDGKKMYKISSWGDVYWIDPDDYKHLTQPIYEQVIYG